MRLLFVSFVFIATCAIAAPKPMQPTDAAAWKAERVQILKQWSDLLGPLPERPKTDVKILSTEDLADHTRLLLRYQNEAGTTNEAYLLLPKTPGKHPAMVCLHPTSKTTIKDPVGLANREGVHHALHLVQRGYVCIAPRNYLWETPGLTYQQAADALLKQGRFKTGLARMLFDAIRAVDVLAERPEVDADRIGCIGHSLGGKESLYLAAFDERIKAAISCEGGIGLSFSNWNADWYLGQQINAPTSKLDHESLLATIAPRGFLLIGGESADGRQSQPYIEAVKPIWHLAGADDSLKLLLHKEGHNFPSPGLDRDTVYQWLDRQLAPNSK